MESKRLKCALRKLVEDGRIDTLALYPSRVLRDHGDMRLDLEPDRPDLPNLVRVPLRTMLPGVVVRVRRDARVLLGFENGDPSRPVATLFDGGALEALTIHAQTSITLQTPDLDLGAEGGTGVLRLGQAITWVFAAPVTPGVPVQATAQAGGSSIVKAVG
ncbi:hypothetical protein [Meiothermus sp.]|uniref:hypothetical protein n=1 Tax=Meiothermus sp. TaxID=1955249 RepID=UPI00307F2252